MVKHNRRTLLVVGVTLLIALGAGVGLTSAAHDDRFETDTTEDRQTILGSEVSSVASSHGSEVSEAATSGRASEVRDVANENGDKVMRILKKKLPG